MKPSIFIGSTSEGTKYAKIVTHRLREIGVCLPWYDGVFEIAGNVQQSLLSNIREADFVIIVLTADDKTESRDKSFFSPRDNLIFEAGIGFGSVSPDRTFLIPEKHDQLKIPSDLQGFTLTPSFESSNSPKDDLAVALDVIEERIVEMGCRRVFKMKKAGKDTLSSSSIELISSADRHIILFGRDLSWAETYSEAIKERIEAGIKVEVFSEKPQSSIARESSSILKKVGATVYHLDRDPGIKLTMIDYQDSKVARFMLAFKERTNLGAQTQFSYNCEIHDAKESRVMWNTLVRLYESTMREIG